MVLSSEHHVHDSQQVEVIVSGTGVHGRERYCRGDIRCYNGFNMSGVGLKVPGMGMMGMGLNVGVWV